MRKMFKRSIGAALIAAALSACSSESDDTPSFSALVFGSAKDIATSRSAGPLEKIVISPEELAKVNVPLLQVNPEVRGGSDFLQRAAVRNDSAMGAVAIWESSDNAQIFLRDGVVVGTRGIGGDIIAAGARSTLQALKLRGKRSGGVRSFVISDGDVTTTEYRFRCTVSNLGSEGVSIANQVVTTDHMRESCVEDAGKNRSFQNDYWVQRSTGLVRKSRQWMGPRTGYFELILLKN